MLAEIKCHEPPLVQPNNSFKPNLLRYTKHMAEKACHVFGSTTQVGLTQALAGANSLLKVVQVRFAFLVSFASVGAFPA